MSASKCKRRCAAAVWSLLLLGGPLPSGGSAAAAEPAKSYDELQAAADDAWVRGPMIIRKAVFTTEKAAAFGDYKLREGSAFARGSTMHVYLEPACWVWKREPDGSFSFGYALEITVKGSDGVVYFELKSPPVPSRRHWKEKELHGLVDLALPEQLPLGPYELILTARDLFSPKSATASLPFTLVARPQP